MCCFSSADRELGLGLGQKRQGEGNRANVKTNRGVEWADHGGSWLSFIREQGKERNRQGEVKGGDMVSSLLHWMVTPRTEAENTEGEVKSEKDDELGFRKLEFKRQ